MTIQFKFKIRDGYLLFLISFHQFTMLPNKDHKFMKRFLDFVNQRTMIFCQWDRKIGSIKVQSVRLMTNLNCYVLMGIGDSDQVLGEIFSP